MKVEWTPQAGQDVAAQVDYLAVDNPIAAISMGDEIRRQAGMLAEHPTLGRAGRVRGTRELVIAGTPYILDYRIKGEAVQVLRILPGARQWPKGFADKR